MALTRKYEPSIYTKPRKARNKKKSQAAKRALKAVQAGEIDESFVQTLSIDVRQTYYRLKSIANSRQANQDRKAKSRANPANKHGFHRTPTIKYAPGLKGSDFYNTREWRELRYKTLVMHGKVCMACGAKEGIFHVDHIKPRSKHPEMELNQDNLQVLCESCNLGKSNTDETDWRTK
jgi:5-methylcytosine-specific restriction endonuclease McrA